MPLSRASTPTCTAWSNQSRKTASTATSWTASGWSETPGCGVPRPPPEGVSGRLGAARRWPELQRARCAEQRGRYLGVDHEDGDRLEVGAKAPLVLEARAKARARERFAQPRHDAAADV